MKNFKNKVIVITGAGNGIGRAIAEEAAIRGMKLVLNDILESGLNETIAAIAKYQPEVVKVVSDMSLYENVEELFNVTIEKFEQVDVLVSNAGVAISAPVWETPRQDIDWINEINYLSHAYAMHLFIPQMIKQGTEAAVVNVASAAGLMIGGDANLYHATKSADLALAESSYLGLKKRGHEQIQVHAFCPAFIQTNLGNSDDYRPDRYKDMSDSYYQSQEYKASLFRGALSLNNGMPIDSVGMSVFTAIEEKKFYILTHPEVVLASKKKFDNLYNFRNPSL